MGDRWSGEIPSGGRFCLLRPAARDDGFERRGIDPAVEVEIGGQKGVMQQEVLETHEGVERVWVEPKIELAENFGLPERELGRIQELVERHEHEIRKAWNRHFSGDR